jgi:hypothetical protein
MNKPTPLAELSDAAQAVYRVTREWYPLGLDVLLQSAWPLGATEFLEAVCELTLTGHLVVARPVNPEAEPLSSIDGNYAVRAWHMPEWMEPFRSYLRHTGTWTAEQILNRPELIFGGSSDSLYGPAERARYMSVGDQVRLLYTLHGRGLFVDPLPCPECGDRNTRRVYVGPDYLELFAQRGIEVWQCNATAHPSPYRWEKAFPRTPLSAAELDLLCTRQLEARETHG